MRTFKYVISDELGIHARPAGLLVKEAEKFVSDITFEVNGKQADARRIFALMSLGAKKDMEITVRVAGDDEEEAALAIEEFLKENL